MLNSPAERQSPCRTPLVISILNLFHWCRSAFVEYLFTLTFRWTCFQLSQGVSNDWRYFAVLLWLLCGNCRTRLILSSAFIIIFYVLLSWYLFSWLKLYYVFIISIAITYQSWMVVFSSGYLTLSKFMSWLECNHWINTAITA